MKKLFLIFILFVVSCAGSTNKEFAPETDSVKLEIIAAEDPNQYVAKTIETPVISSKPIIKSIYAPVPIVFPETISVQKDTIIKKSLEKRSMDISQLDTTSYIPELKENVRKINYQQKQLDSLLKKKK